jgi:hypothetical protein
MKTAMTELIEMMNDAKEKGFQNLDWLMLIRTYSLLKKEKEQQLNLIRFLRTNDKMGKSVDDLYNEFYNQNK